MGGVNIQKSLSDVSNYLKGLVPVNIPESYGLSRRVCNLLDERSIRNGVNSFKNFLIFVYDKLITEGSKYEKISKSKEKEDMHASLSDSYPFLNNLRSILFILGYYGRFSEDGATVLLENGQLLNSIIRVNGRILKSKISSSDLFKCISFLAECGFNITGINLEDEAQKVDISIIETVIFSFPQKPDMLIGLKVMAVAQKDLFTKGNGDILMRCDYRVLSEEEKDVDSVLKDFVNPLDIEVQNFILHMHKHFIEAGLVCKINVFLLDVWLIYLDKNKEVWTLSASMDSGYRMLVKTKNMHMYSDTIEQFPLTLQEKIKRGYGCNRKLFGEPCQKGCHGYSFPLETSILDISSEIKVWLDKEVSSNKRRQGKLKK